MKSCALALPILCVALSSSCKPAARQTANGNVLEDSLHVATADDSLFRTNRPLAMPVETPPWKAEPGAKPSALLLDLEAPTAQDLLAPLADRALGTLRPPVEPKPRSKRVAQ